MKKLAGLNLVDAEIILFGGTLIWGSFTFLKFHVFSLEQQRNSYLSQSSVLEWRFSFSQPEILLAEALHDLPRTAYLAFKATIKRHINALPDQFLNFHKIPSYVLKSIMFREAECIPYGYWDDNKADEITENFFKQLMERLRDCFRRKLSILQRQILWQSS